MPFNGLVRVQPTRKKWGSRKNCKRAAEKKNIQKTNIGENKARNTTYVADGREPHVISNSENPFTPCVSFAVHFAWDD